MNTRVKNAWIKALRSGKYKQGRGNLRSANDTFCCLGVLCDLYARRRVPASQRARWTQTETGSRYEIAGIAGVLPTRVRIWAGLTASDPELGGDTASVWNDHHRATFKKIATLIEKHL